MLLFYILYVLLGLYALVFIIYTWGWYLLPKSQSNTVWNTKPLPFFSIIIPARNEAHQIGNTLKSIIANEYPKHFYEIIIIDDHSEDDTAQVCKDIIAAHPQIQAKVLSLQTLLSPSEKHQSYKKLALAKAIEIAQGDHIITTDADCTVHSQWLQMYAQQYAKGNIHFVIAPVSFTPAAAKKDLLYYFQSIDFMTMQGITAASYRLKIGNMCNGANLSFSKVAFNAVNGYTDINHLASGDDMMLYNKIAKQFPNSVAYIKAQNAIVHTPVQDSWQGFINQRIRWASKNGKYNDLPLTAILMTVYLFNVSLLVATVYGFFNWTWLPTLFCVWLAKILFELLLIIPVGHFYHKGKECIFHLILQPVHTLYIVSAGFLGMFKKYEWKGRKVQ